MQWGFAIAATVACAAGCAREEPSLWGQRAEEHEAPLNVVFRGCELREHSICELRGARPQRLWLWVDTRPSFELRYEIDGEVPEVVEDVEQPDGRMVELNVDGPGLLVVTATAPSAASFDGVLRTWSLELRLAEPIEFLELAAALRSDGELADAAAILDEALAGELPADVEARALGLRARVDVDLQKHDDALDRFERSIQLGREAGLISVPGDDALAAAYVWLFGKHQLTKARLVIEEARDLLLAYGEGQAGLPYYSGLVDQESGDLRTAIQRYAVSEPRAMRLGMEPLTHNVQEARALLLGRVGRFAEAHEILARLRSSLPLDVPLCRRSALDVNLAFMALRSHNEASEPALLLKKVLDVSHSCPARTRDSARFNLAELALQNGAYSEAAKWLDLLERPDENYERYDIAGRIDLAHGRIEAARGAYEALDREARNRGQAMLGWRAALGRGAIALRSGQVEAAKEAFAGAEAILDRESRQVPLGEGRADWLADHEWGTQQYVELLLSQEPGFALDAVRHARARLLLDLFRAARLQALKPAERQVWEGAVSRYRQARVELDDDIANDWRRSVEELAVADSRRKRRVAEVSAALDEALAMPPARDFAHPRQGDLEPRELLLAYYPLQSGWVGFAASRDAVRSVLIGPLEMGSPPDALSESFLLPFAAEIAQASSIRILPYGPSRLIDFHSLPWNGDVLLAAAPVTYPVDLPGLDRPAPSGRALVVADPQGNLPEARREGLGVVASLASAGWDVQFLSGPSVIGLLAEGRPATSGSLRGLLNVVELFHYVGHGQQHGLDGWWSALTLADGGRLTVGDILVSTALPDSVVLSGCETAGSSVTRVDDLGLAQAFIIGGSSTVLATTRIIPDDAGLAKELYRAPGRKGSVPRAAQEALLAWRVAQPEADWAAWRVFVR